MLINITAAGLRCPSVHGEHTSRVTGVQMHGCRASEIITEYGSVPCTWAVIRSIVRQAAAPVVVCYRTAR